jgi:methyl-accepting chemotaxis protein
MMEGSFKDAETRMASELKKYKENYSEIPTELQIWTHDQTAKDWAEYVKLSAQAAQISYENTNYKAQTLNEGMMEFWDGLDADFADLSHAAMSGEGRSAAANTEAINTLRSGLLRYRFDMEKYLTETDPKAREERETALRESMDGATRTLQTLSAGLPADGGRRAAAILEKIRDTASPALGQIIELIRNDSAARANDIMNGSALDAATALGKTSATGLAAIATSMDSSVASGRELGTQMKTLMIAVGGIGIAVALLLAYVIVRNITRGLNSIIRNLGESSSQVNEAANQISGSSQSLAEGSTEQAASLEETSSALEEMASMTRQNADNANKTNETTRSNDALISTGATAVTNMSQAMSEINTSAEQISHIIKTIEDIAFQTNLLALNAAVEAARAGEAGKGFAVVADEVRNLASRSAQAAKDTTQLIETTIERVRNGSEIASELDGSFKQIEEGSLQVSSLIGEITAATNEQAQGVDQINTAVAQMDKVTQSNAASAEEAASSAEQLSAQASALSGMVGDLVSMVEGKPRAVKNASAAAADADTKVMTMGKSEIEAAYSTVKRPASALKMLTGGGGFPLDPAGAF